MMWTCYHQLPFFKFCLLFDIFFTCATFFLTCLPCTNLEHESLVCFPLDLLIAVLIAADKPPLQPHASVRSCLCQPCVAAAGRLRIRFPKPFVSARIRLAYRFRLSSSYGRPNWSIYPDRTQCFCSLFCTAAVFIFHQIVSLLLLLLLHNASHAQRPAGKKGTSWAPLIKACQSNTHPTSPGNSLEWVMGCRMYADGIFDPRDAKCWGKKHHFFHISNNAA